jgi:glucan biosynthesis protein C
MDSRPTEETPAPARLHALDSLRALMMWLGIVLHVSIIHMVQAPLVPWRDEQRTMAADLLVGFIHAFRMPVFFILAGYFVAQLLRSRGPRGLAVHRLRRLALPFIVFWPPLFLALGIFMLLFLHRMVHGTWGIDPAMKPTGPAIPDGASTIHLWFLWMLLWFSLLAAALASVRGPWLQRGLARAGATLQRLGSTWWGVPLLALPLVLAGLGYPNGFLTPSGSFLPQASEWLHHGLFFAFGIALYHQQWELFALYKRRWVAHAVAGLVAYVATGALVEARAHPFWTGFAYNACTWLWSFAVLGLGTRFLATRKPWLAYLADSSYWVYLVHMPLTVAFGALLYGLALPAFVKMAINIAATTAVCLASYQLFVRSTWIGVLLNGRRRARSPFSGGLAHVAR